MEEYFTFIHLLKVHVCAHLASAEELLQESQQLPLYIGFLNALT